MTISSTAPTRQIQRYLIAGRTYLGRDWTVAVYLGHRGEATVVRFHVTVLSLDTIDEGSMTYVADIFMSQSWKDHRLRLPENMTMKYRLLPVSWLKRMWRPDSFFKNAKRVTFQEMTIPNHYIWLYSDKTILYMVKESGFLALTYLANIFVTTQHMREHVIRRSRNTYRVRLFDTNSPCRVAPDANGHSAED
ncbi:glycine receptor subunit alpha-2 [Trichonephila inaurata madagascariensis]|uniref:Glycine receptor subunit alpha-2 n=1 Tax=Trichonephila inaurata madagascariensis TaxID=2747483 RepID=A0A8X6IPI7_9ARAC|nr:glycine receptor subunit alpha-2 [Trichonephila inaurata madagascariensis]